MAEGLRERKKLQTRQAIFDAARRLFRQRGFEQVSVAEIARAADVSEMTVFNHFRNKEELFYGGMQFFEEELVATVRDRPSGEPALEAFRRRLLSGLDRLAKPETFEEIRVSTRIVGQSPALAAREREMVERFTSDLAEVLSSQKDDAVALSAAAAMMGAHRALVAHVRRRVLAGVRGKRLADSYRSEARRVFARLGRGLGDYAVKR